MPLADLHRVFALIAGVVVYSTCDERRCFWDLLDRQDVQVVTIFTCMAIYEIIVLGVKKWLKSSR